MLSDASGDPIVVGRAYRNEVIGLFNFEQTAETEPVDTTGNITYRNLIGDYYKGSNVTSGAPNGKGSTGGLMIDAWDGTAWSDTHLELEPGNTTGVYGYKDSFDPNGNWTVEGFFSVDESNDQQDTRLATVGGTHHVLFGIGEGNSPGVTVMLNRSTKAIDWYASATTQRTAGAISTVNNIIVNNIGYVHIALTKKW